jgi:hypothetical protein
VDRKPLDVEDASEGHPVIVGAEHGVSQMVEQMAPPHAPAEGSRLSTVPDCPA